MIDLLAALVVNIIASRMELSPQAAKYVKKDMARKTAYGRW